MPGTAVGSPGWLRVENGQGWVVLSGQPSRFEGGIGMRSCEGRGSFRTPLPLSRRDPEGPDPD